MPYPFDTTDTAAIARLSQYNGGPYNATTNPRGLAVGGHVVNVPLVTSDIARTANAVSSAAGAAETSITAAVDEAAAAQVAAQSARSDAVAARDIAAGYASSAVSQGNVPVYSTLSGMGSITIPAGIITARVNGYGAAGDMGDGLYQRVASQPSHGGRFRSQDRFLPNGSTDNTNGGWWERVPTAEVRPEEFGFAGVSTSTDRAALIAAAAYCVAKGGVLTLQDGKTYNIGTTATALNGVSIRPGIGTILQGNLDQKASYRLLLPLTVRFQDTDFTYPDRVLSAQYRRRITEKDVFLDEGDIDRSINVPINGTSWQQMETDWPNGGGFSAVSSSASTDELAFITADSKLYSGLLDIRGGDQLHTFFSFGEYSRAAIVRTLKGHYTLVCSGMAGAGTLYYTPRAGTRTTVTTLDWQGRSDQTYWQPGFSEWTIDVITPKQFAFKINGLTLGSFAVAGDDVIIQAGFGVTGSPTIAKITYSTLTRGGRTAGRGNYDIMVVGDSRAAPYWDDFPTHLADKLEGAGGAHVLRMSNLAVDGWTTSTTLTTVQAAGVSGRTHVVYHAVTNDAQSGVALATTKSKIEQTIDYIQSANVRCIVALPLNYYPAASSGRGMTVYNEVYLSQYRALLRKVAASRGCPIVDVSSIAKPVLPYEAMASPPDARFLDQSETGLRDNIHHGGYLSKLIADRIARIILSDQPARRRGFDEMALPASVMQNSWLLNGSFKPRIHMSDGGAVHLSGWITAGTKTANTIVAVLAASLAPSNEIYLRVMSDNNAAIRVKVNTAGQITLVDGLGGSDNNLILDGLSWSAG